MLIYNIGKTGVVEALTNSVPLTLYLAENYDAARKGMEKCLKIRNFSSSHDICDRNYPNFNDTSLI